MEHDVRQQSEKWFELRRQVVVTASRFADAIGVGKGKPFDFLKSLNEAKQCDDTINSFTQHGTEMEPIIHEAYQLLTGNRTRQSGFWTIKDDRDPLKDKVGASPDAIVVNAAGKDVGLCEFKAPVHSMYRDIPLHYMVQIQGQMAITELPWCDFMALCRSKREIMLRRVHFCPQFWNVVAKRLLEFCTAYQDFVDKESNQVDSMAIYNIKQWSILNSLQFQNKIEVTDLLRTCNIGKDNFCGPSGHLLNFDLLLGSPSELERRSINY